MYTLFTLKKCNFCWVSRSKGPFFTTIRASGGGPEPAVFWECPIQAGLRNSGSVELPCTPCISNNETMLHELHSGQKLSLK